jgi:hypothetical protein
MVIAMPKNVRKGRLHFLEIMEAAETDLTQTDEAMVDLVPRRTEALSFTGC